MTWNDGRTSQCSHRQSNLASLTLGMSSVDFATSRRLLAPPSEVLPCKKVSYGRKRVGDVEVFYREAGRPDTPVILRLHGFPTSPHLFRHLIPALADRYRVTG
jgi:hypothetical protein